MLWTSLEKASVALVVSFLFLDLLVGLGGFRDARKSSHNISLTNLRIRGVIMMQIVICLFVRVIVRGSKCTNFAQRADWSDDRRKRSWLGTSHKLR